MLANSSRNSPLWEKASSWSFVLLCIRVLAICANLLAACEDSQARAFLFRFNDLTFQRFNAFWLRLCRAGSIRGRPLNLPEDFTMILTHLSPVFMRKYLKNRL